ncbi:MAG: NADP-dependent oxidoreductase [Acidimicrobiia bacterium]
MTHDIPIPPTMNAIRLHAPGGVENLVYEEIDTPTPAAGDALVRVHAAAITRDELDWPVDRLPAIPSYEVSGTVVAIGEDSSGGVEVGQAVYALTAFDRDGVAAEYAIVPADQLASKPESLSHVESAAVPLPALSAMQGLFDHGLLEKNQRVLIHGAAGGVGQYAVQLARVHGAYVIATTSAERADTARMLGADEVIDHTATDFTTIEPVSLVFDTAGGDRLIRSASVVASGGRLVSVAEEPPTDLSAERGVAGIYFVVKPDQTHLDELTHLVDQGIIRSLVDKTYPLADARDAFARSLSRSGRGKVVLTVV